MVSEAVSLLNKRLTHFLAHRLKWNDLNSIQKETIPSILEGNDTLIISPTASGKTEAVLLPVFSEILDNHYEPLSVLYVAPLKALINDIYDRIDLWTKYFDLTVTKWHGDVAKSYKNKFLKKPTDFLVITPESLEVIFMNRDENEKMKVFKNLKYVIVDEIHYFAESDRGIQLNSLLNRINKYCDRKPIRLGLSATVGNPGTVAKWLNYENPPKIIKNTNSRRLQYKLWDTNELKTVKRLKKYSNKKILIFVPSRSLAEHYFSLLKQLRFSNIFIHHSSIDREYRENSEKKFKKSKFSIMVSTSTLELGIDVGDIDIVVQIEPPYTISSFLQRIGRGGRESKLQRTIITGNQMSILVALAEIILIKEDLIENINIPTNSKDIFFHQILSSIFEKSKVDYKELYYNLTSSYVFSDISKKEYMNILKHMEKQEFIYINEKFLTLGYTFEEKFGKNNFRNFYSVFCPNHEFQVKNDNVMVGSIDASFVTFLRPGESFILGGKKWNIIQIDKKHRIVKVIQNPISESCIPKWSSYGLTLSYLISRKTYEVLLNQYPEKLVKTSDNFDKHAQKTLELAQKKAFESGFAEGIIPVEITNGRVYIYTFAGDKANVLLTILFSFYYKISNIHISPFYSSFIVKGSISFQEIEKIIYGAEKVLNSCNIYDLIYHFTDKFYKNKFINFLPQKDEVELKMRLLYDKDNLIKVINENALMQVYDVDFDKWFI